MKKGLYILFFIFGLVITSCNKEVIAPNNDINEVPTWSSNRSVEDGDDDNGKDDEAGSGGVVVMDDVEITDPNTDPDGE